VPSLLVASYRAARRIVIGTVGATVLAIGVALIVLPGPAFVVIPIGLGILGLEFAWARRWLRKLRAGASSVIASATGKPPQGPPPIGLIACLAVLPLLIGASCRPEIDVGMPDPVSGDVRVEIVAGEGIERSGVRIALDGADVSSEFVPGGPGLVGFLADPPPGAHEITVFQPLFGLPFGFWQRLAFVSPAPAPALVASRPDAAAGPVPRTAWLELELAAPPDPAALAGWGFGVECGGRRVASRHQIVSDARVVVNPEPALPPGASCRVAWRGPGGAVTGVEFAVAPDAAGAPATALYDRGDLGSVAPFPDDYWLVPDASTPSGRRIALELPAYAGVLGLAANGVAQSLAGRDGYSPVQPIVLGFSHAVDRAALPQGELASLDPAAPLALFDVDPKSPGYGRRVGFRVESRDDPGPGGAVDHNLLLFPAQVLREGGHYALVVTNRLFANGAPGRPFEASDFALLATGAAVPGEPAAVARARATLLPALEFAATVPELAIPPEDVALALPISIRSRAFDPSDWVFAKERALAAAPPAITVNEEIDRGADRVLRGTIDLPFYLAEGLVDVSRDPSTGAPLAASRDAVPFVMRIPNGAVGPLPIVIYQHGSPGSPEEVLSQSQKFLVDSGYAVIGIQDLVNRRFGATESALTTAILLRIVAYGRGPLIHFQTQADLMGLLRAVEGMGTPESFPEIDPTRIFYRGISFGAHHSLGFLPFAPEITAAVSVVGGGRTFENTLHQLDFYGTLPGLQAVLPNANATILLVGLAALQNDADRDDPIYLARHLYRERLAIAGERDPAPPSLLWLEGIDDSIVSNNATRSAAGELGLAQVEPIEARTSFEPALPAPVAGNVAPGVTGGHFQYRPLTTPSCVGVLQLEGHYCPQIAAEAAAQILHFFATAETGTAEIVNPLLEATP
jgi:dienelactone hydrolase